MVSAFGDAHSAPDRPDTNRSAAGVSIKPPQSAAGDPNQLQALVGASASGSAALGEIKERTGKKENKMNKMILPEHPCISGFKWQDPEEMLCLVVIKSGTLNLQGCHLSVESIKPTAMQYKIPCIYQMPDTTSFMR